MLYTKFRGNRSNGSGEDFLRDFNINGHGSHLGHVTSIRSSNFNFLVPKSFLTNLVQNGPFVSEKSQF